MPGFSLFCAVGVFFSDADFMEVFIWGFIFVFIIIFLFILNRLLRLQIGSKVKRSQLPFGMSPADLDKLKETGQLTDEELKRIRHTLARKIVERAEEEERIKNQDPLAQQASTVGKELHKEEIERLRDLKVDLPEKPRQERRIIPDNDPRTGLPPHLQQLVSKNVMELEELEAAGFITSEDRERIRKAKEESG